MSSAPRVIFHYPRPLPDRPQTGSSVRVASMLAGFRELGAEVTVVDGWSSPRRATMRSLKRAVRRGERFDVVYSEFTTMPTMLADEHHLPTHPAADFTFLRTMRRHGAGVGVFYRDVYWRFQPYRDSVSRFRGLGARGAYLAELAGLRACVDALFLPSLPMAKYLPGWAEDERVHALPPGGVVEDEPWTPVDGQLRLLYVGGVKPPIYDVAPLVEAVASAAGIVLTVCCPESERDHLRRWESAPNVEVVHATGADARALYASADVACVYFGHDVYRDFAMPVKLFEAIGRGRPVLANSEDFVGRFVAEHGLGWAVRPAELRDLIANLARQRSEVERRRAAVIAARPQHTWQARCATALEVLMARRGRR